MKIKNLKENFFKKIKGQKPSYNKILFDEINKQLEIKPIKFWEYIIVILGLFMSTYTLIPLLRDILGNSYDAAEGDSFMQSIWFLIYFLTTLTLLFYRKYIFFHLFKDKALWAIILMTYFSIYWSSNSSLTFRRAVAITLTHLFGIYIGCTFTWSKILKILQIVFGISSSLSIVFVIFLPSISKDETFKTAFRGVYLHKNSLGIFMAISIVIWLISSLDSITKLYKKNDSRNFKFVLINVFFFILSLILLLLSQSKTSFMVLLITISIAFIFKLILHKKHTLSFFNILFFSILATIILFSRNYDYILSILGKESTLTGRIPLWTLVWSFFLEKPFIGHGFSSFWSTNNGGAYYISDVLFTSPNAHNGYLDILINLGIVGILLFFISFRKNIILSISFIKANSYYLSFIPFCLFIYLIIYNFTESFLLVQNSFAWIIFVTLTYKLRLDSETYNIKA
ncbi:MAG: O-antigen ligase family protein [Clostridiales bacterium]